MQWPYPFVYQAIYYFIMTNNVREPGISLSILLLVTGLCFLVFGGTLMFLDGDFPAFFLEAGITMSVLGCIFGLFVVMIRSKTPSHAARNEFDQ